VRRFLIYFLFFLFTRKGFLKVLNNRRHSWIGHIIRHNEFVVYILEEAISGKKAMGRPRLQYLTLTLLTWRIW
jgi:hypothetical protein